jgi:hypothetical protein
MMKTATKAILMFPIPFFLLFGAWYIATGNPAGDLSIFMASFAAVYVPALTSFVAGTTMKRQQQRTTDERRNIPAG